jgi:uncharacterized LabA/DUF88 family protein
LSKNVAVFVDVANIFYAAKAAGVDIDYVTLLKASSAGRDLVRAYAYTGLDPDNENQRNFHDFLRRHGYKVVSKDIRKYGDGKVKANLDIELVVDMMKTARNLDIAIVVSGDGDFAPAIRAVQEMGVRVEVVSFRGNTSSDLIEVADIFTDITQVAKVEKGSSRSGRRVATDDEDLSMTEVPDKMTEGTGDGRRRGRGRTRTGEPAAAAPARRTSTGRARAAVEREVPAEVAIVALPGEKLSRARRPAAAAAELVEEQPFPVVELEPEAGDPEGEAPEGEEVLGEDGLPRRRRRRRGGRGRGRGRAREAGVAVGDEGPVEVGEADELDELAPPAGVVPPPAPRRAASSFGSVWDSQLGMPSGSRVAATGGGLPLDDEDLDEPSVPEYLLAERRQRDAGRGGRPMGGRGGRGRGGAYAAAMDRERFGSSSGRSRFAEPQRGPEPIRREPAGQRGGRPPARGFDRPEPRSTSGDPWSEVPPEIEAMLRAQLASGAGRAARPAAEPVRRAPAVTTEPSQEAEAAPRRARRPAARRPGSEPAGVGSAERAPDAASAVDGGTAPTPARRAPATRRTAKVADPATPAGGEVAAATTTPKRTRRPAAAKAPAAGGATEAAPAEAPAKRRVTRKKAAPTA